MTNLSCSLNPNQIISECHNATAKPSLLLFLFAAIIVYALSSIIVFEKERTNWIKVAFAGLVFTILMIGFFLFISNSPFLVEKISGIF